MANTRRNRKNRKNTMRKNRKQRGAGFFDFFKRSTPAVAPAPVANAPMTTNVKAPLNTNLPPAAAPAAAAPRRSFMNRLRGARNSAMGSLRSVRNTARNYGSAMRNQMSVLRNKTVRNQMYA